MQDLNSLNIDFLIDRFKNTPDATAIIYNNKNYSYLWLLEKIDQYKNKFISSNLSNKVVALKGDYDPYTIAGLIALLEINSIIVPYNKEIKAKIEEEYDAIAQVENKIVFENTTFYINTLSEKASHNLILKLKKESNSGLILFSSGSTGKSKAIIHNFNLLLEKFKKLKKSKCIIPFLLFDHIGGINTLFHSLSNLGTIVTVKKRTVEEICRAIEMCSVQILPVSPTFLNLLIISGIYKKYDLSSLEVISYGTEVMSESVLQKINNTFPGVKILQTYGLSETGILDTRSESNSSTWVKLGGEDIKLRVKDNMLEIKTPSAMLGYLNDAAPFTEDGWLKTNDLVEEKGDYFRFIGRKSEIINVGGKKVYPSEVENVVLGIDNVEDVSVMSERNSIIGQIVKAKIKLKDNMSLRDFTHKMKVFCRERLENFKIPQKIEIVKDDELYNERFKKNRL